MIPRGLNRVLPQDEKKRAAIFAAVSFLAGMMLSPVMSFTIIGTLASLQERAIMPMLSQRIEVVREASRHISCPPSVADAPIVQAILDWNLRVAHERESNQHWMTDLFSPDGWLSIEPIAFPCEETP